MRVIAWLKLPSSRRTLDWWFANTPLLDLASALHASLLNQLLKQVARLLYLLLKCEYYWRVLQEKSVMGAKAAANLVRHGRWIVRGSCGAQYWVKLQVFSAILPDSCCTTRRFARHLAFTMRVPSLRMAWCQNALPAFWGACLRCRDRHLKVNGHS
jgi:hypothetical protein